MNMFEFVGLLAIVVFLLVAVGYALGIIKIEIDIKK